MLRSRLAIAALSAFSLLAGHEVAYRAAAWPGSPARLLHATGHGWWGLAGPVAGGSLMLLMLLALSARTVGSYRLVPRLATALFLTVEVLERLLHGTALDVGSSWLPVVVGAAVTYIIAAAAGSLQQAAEATLSFPSSAAPLRTPSAAPLLQPGRAPAIRSFSVLSTPLRGPPLPV